MIKTHHLRPSALHCPEIAPTFKKLRRFARLFKMRKPSHENKTILYHSVGAYEPAPESTFWDWLQAIEYSKKNCGISGRKPAFQSLLRKNVSASLEISACEGKVCKKKKLRASKKELLHFQRIGKNRRVFFAKGPNAPRCVILRGNRQYVCSQCRKNANENCRSFPSDDSSLLPGTNIDLADFELLTQGVKSSKCSELKKQPNYFKIDLRRKAKGYDRIVAYYDKKKKVPITMNFFSSKVMRKVYRFFPKYYIRVENQWFSTVLRVRTTQGKEKSYVFETLVHVAKEGKKLRLFTDALRDPHLKGVSADSLFITD